jgi:DNA-binding MarR family transcriptional regulator
VAATVARVTLRPDDTAVDVWQRLLHFQRSAARRLDADLQTERGLSLEDYDVLYQLDDAGGHLRMSEVAGAALIARSSCTRVVDRLVDRGWVERRPHEVDRRSVVVALTGEGRRVLGRAAVTHLRGIEAVFAARLTTRDVDDLARIVGRLSATTG